MLVTLLGMSNRVFPAHGMHCTLPRVEEPGEARPNPRQDENAKAPMLVTLLGMSTLAKLVQPLNACEPMLVTLLGMARRAFPAHGTHCTLPRVVDPGATRPHPRQDGNASLPSSVPLLGMTTLAKLEQLSNTPSPM